jgi:hypothetical protein
LFVPAIAPPALGLPAATVLSNRLALTLGGLYRAIAARCAGRDAAITVARPLLILLWSRLNRTVLRFASLAARAAAGRLAAPRQRPARPAPVSPGPVSPSSSPSPLSSPRPRQPQGFFWLVRLVPEAAAYASQLQYTLAEPEIAALLAATPQAGRILRPLCRMLGVPLPPALRLARVPRARPANPAGGSAAAQSAAHQTPGTTPPSARPPRGADAGRRVPPTPGVPRLRRRPAFARGPAFAPAFAID